MCNPGREEKGLYLLAMEIAVAMPNMLRLWPDTPQLEFTRFEWVLNSYKNSWWKESDVEKPEAFYLRNFIKEKFALFDVHQGKGGITV